MRAVLEVLWLWLALIFWVAAVVVTGAGFGLLAFAVLYTITG